MREPEFRYHLRHRQQIGPVLGVRHALDLGGASFNADFREANRPHTSERRAPVFSAISRPAACPV